MSRTVRRVLQSTLVCSLVLVLTVGPASAGWLKRQQACKPACPPPPCVVVPACCEPAPPCCEPVVAVDPCAGGVVVGSTVPMTDSIIIEPMVVEPMPIELTPAESISPSDNANSTPAGDDEDPAMDNLLDDDNAPEDPSDEGVPGALKPVVENPAPADTDPVPTPSTEGPSAADVFGGEPSTPLDPMPAETAPTDPAPTDAAPTDDDIFGGEPAMEAVPADPAPADPAPADPAPTDDDIFGGEPAMEAVPADPAPADAAPAADDIFGGEPVMEAPPADAAPAADDIFGSDPAMEAAPADAAPADDIFGGAAPADDIFGGAADSGPASLDEVMSGDGSAPAADDIFGEAPAMEAPPADDIFGEPEAAAPSADDIFGTPEDAPKPAADAIDDIFGAAPAAQDSGSDEDAFAAPVNTDQPENPGIDLEDLFSNSEAKLAETTVRTVADPLAATEIRVWIDNTGGFSTKGRLIKIESDVVRLMKENGRTCTVPLRRLSPADARYVDSIERQLPAETVAMLIND